MKCAVYTESLRLIFPRIYGPIVNLIYLLFNSSSKLWTLGLKKCDKSRVDVSFSLMVNLPLLGQSLVQKVSRCVCSDSQLVTVEWLHIQVADITMDLLPGRGVASITELVI